MTDWLTDWKRVRMFTSAARAMQCSSLCCLCFCVDNSRVSQRVCYWQLSPFPWAGVAVCCVGRGYTCSGLVRPRYRCTSHLRPVPSCRFASLPPGSDKEPAETEKQKNVCLRPSGETGCLCQLLFIYVATKLTFQNARGLTRYFSLPACINSFLKSVTAF